MRLHFSANFPSIIPIIKTKIKETSNTFTATSTQSISFDDTLPSYSSTLFISSLADIWQFREHQTDPSYYPIFSFYKPSDTIVRIESAPDSVGEGYVFATFPKSYLDGKKIQIYWYSHSASESHIVPFPIIYVYGRVLVIDTTLDRKQSLPIEDIRSILSGSNINYITAIETTNAGLWLTHTSDVLDLSGFTSNTVTLLISTAYLIAGHTTMLDVDWIKILDANDNVLATYDFTGDITMEVTGTYEDYGFMPRI